LPKLIPEIDLPSIIFTVDQFNFFGAKIAKIRLLKKLKNSL